MAFDAPVNFAVISEQIMEEDDHFYEREMFFCTSVNLRRRRFYFSSFSVLAVRGPGWRHFLYCVSLETRAARATKHSRGQLCRPCLCPLATSPCPLAPRCATVISCPRLLPLPARRFSRLPFSGRHGTRSRALQRLVKMLIPPSRVSVFAY